MLACKQGQNVHAYADDEDYEDDSFDLMMQQLMGDLMRSPEMVKNMIMNECETGIVASEPMLGLYHTIITDVNGELDSNSAVPSSLTVCRPKLVGPGPRGDEQAVQCAPYQILLTLMLCMFVCI